MMSHSVGVVAEDHAEVENGMTNRRGRDAESKWPDLRLGRELSQDHERNDQQCDRSSVEWLVGTYKEAHGGIKKNQAAQGGHDCRTYQGWLGCFHCYKQPPNNWERDN